MSFELLTASGFKLVKVTATGPSTNTTINAGNPGSLALSVASNPFRLLALEAIASISGLPSGIVISNITFTGTSTVTLSVFNASTSNVTVNANTVTATILAKAV